MLDAYVADYLKEEVAAEGLVRNLPSFSEFLDVTALSDGEIVNFSSIARECAVSSHTTKSHFQILEDALLGRWLPAYRKRPTRRVIRAPKFYFVDVGVVNRLAKREHSCRDRSSTARSLRTGCFTSSLPSRAIGTSTATSRTGA